MPAIGSVNVKVAATTAGLTAGLTSAASQIRGFSAGIKSMGSTVGSGMATAGTGVMGLVSKLGPLAAAAAGAAGIAGLGLMVSNSMDAIDATAKLADTIGVSTEQMVGYQHAAELSGVSSEALQGAMGKLSRQGMTLEGLADQMSALSDPSDRMRLAYDKLGKSGADMLPLLREGGDAIRDMVKEGAELKGFSREDAAAVEEANDAISKVQASVVGVANTFAIALAPAITWVADKATAFGKMVKSTFDSLRPVFTQMGNTLMAEFEAIGRVAAPIFDWIGTTGVTAFTDIRDVGFDMLATLEFGWMNIETIAAWAWSSAELGAVQLWENVKHIFTVAIPTAVSWFADSVAKMSMFAWDSAKLGAVIYFEEVSHTLLERIPAALDWFANNWQDVTTTVANHHLTVFKNLVNNQIEIYKGLLEFVRTGEFKPDLRPLTEGFENTIKSMPNIPERVMGDVEKNLRDSVSASRSAFESIKGIEIPDRVVGDFERQLSSSVSSMGADLGAGLGEHLAKRRAELLSPEEKLKADPLKDMESSTGDRNMAGPAAVNRGSSAAFSAIFRGMRGDSVGDLPKTAAETLAVAKQQLRSTRKAESQQRIELIRGEV